MARTSRGWRHLTVWLHILSSVSWMALTLALFAMLLLAATTPDPVTAAGATGMAHYLDLALLAPLANTSAATGLVLSLATAWGLTHHYWVLTKFAITIVQLYAGIFLLEDALDAAATVTSAPPFTLIAGTVAMAGALAFQAWLSVAKPGGRTRWSRDRRTGQQVRLPTAAPWVFAVAVLGPLADIALGIVLGFPSPFLSLTAVAVAAGARRRVLRAERTRAEARPLARTETA